MGFESIEVIVDVDVEVGGVVVVAVVDVGKVLNGRIVNEDKGVCCVR